MMVKHNAYRNGKIHVCQEMCPTCVFRPGNQMDLHPGRVAEMVADATKKQTAIICHSTLDGDNAVCFGFYDKYPTQPLQVAERLGFITFVPTPQTL